MAFDRLRFVKHVRSFTDGRVRVRHPALEDAALTETARAALASAPGMLKVDINPQTGSALIVYDPAAIDRDSLIEKGILWAQWLDERRAGAATPPPAL